MFKVYCFLLILLTASLFPKERDNNLVCIHGFMGAPWNMGFLEKNLKKDGWDVRNWQYPSRDKVIKNHSEQLVCYLKSLALNNPGKPIYFITHSMGSLVLLAALNNPNCPSEAKTGKIVLIAPPLKGSAFGRWLAQFSLARWIAKDFSGNELMNKSNFDYLGKFPDSLDGILIISGTLGFNPILKEKNDGTLALNETRLSIPHEHQFVKRGHKTIVFSKKVCGLAREFFLKPNS
jgi:predicted alpha/beta hydrolase family esterase